MELEMLYLCGMIGKVKKNGGVVKCIPVFTSDEKHYYTQKRNKREKRPEYIPIDIGEYGAPLFLPASKKKIDDGKEYFFIFQPKKSKEFFGWRIYAIQNLSVGIYDNKEFCVLREFSAIERSEEEMTERYLNLPNGFPF